MERQQEYIQKGVGLTMTTTLTDDLSCRAVNSPFSWIGPQIEISPAISSATDTDMSCWSGVCSTVCNNEAAGMQPGIFIYTFDQSRMIHGFSTKEQKRSSESVLFVSIEVLDKTLRRLTLTDDVRLSVRKEL